MVQRKILMHYGWMGGIEVIANTCIRTKWIREENIKYEKEKGGVVRNWRRGECTIEEQIAYERIKWFLSLVGWCLHRNKGDWCLLLVGTYKEKLIKRSFVVLFVNGLHDIWCSMFFL